MDKTEAKFIRLTTQPIFKLLCLLSAPAIAGMLITAIYNAADSYFVSKINDSAVGSVGVIFSFMAIIQAFGFMCGHGAGNFMSRELGKKNYEDSGRLAVTGTVIAFLIGAILAVFGLLFLDELALFLGSTPTILPYARDYLRYILIAAPFQTAAGGFDMLSHVMEVYFSAPDDNNLSDAISEAIMRDVIRNLPKALNNPTSYAAR